MIILPKQVELPAPWLAFIWRQKSLRFASSRLRCNSLKIPSHCKVADMRWFWYVSAMASAEKFCKLPICWARRRISKELGREFQWCNLCLCVFARMQMQMMHLQAEIYIKLLELAFQLANTANKPFFNSLTRFKSFHSSHLRWRISNHKFWQAKCSVLLGRLLRANTIHFHLMTSAWLRKI